MKRLIVVIFLAFNYINCQENKFEKLNLYFEELEQNEKAMGAVSIFQDGIEVYSNFIGYSNNAKKIKSSRETVYRIGSISKTFTASLIMKAIEMKKLSLKTNLSEFFPKVINSDLITIEMLLNHSSGIKEITKVVDFESWKMNFTTKVKLLDTIYDLPSLFNPGEKSEYSNTNYILLSLILEHVFNKNFNSILENLICIPCDLKQTYYSYNSVITKNEALSYVNSINSEEAESTHLSIPIGAGGIISSAIDLGKFLNCLFENKFLSKSTTDKMIQIEDKYGFGLFEVPFYDKRGFGHTGGIDGFQANAFFFPDDNMTVSYVSNGVITPVNDIMIAILSIYFELDYSIPKHKKYLPSDLSKLVGEYSSSSIDLNVEIKLKNDTLFLKTIQGEIPLESNENFVFTYRRAGLELIFNIYEKPQQLILKQRDVEITYKKN
ncbi:MAG: serine hydrolase domain-containing protein [Winogradskyella sp.]